MSATDVLYKIRHAVALSAVAVVWLVLGMVYFGRFFPPFDRLESILMPWKTLGDALLIAGFDERFDFMQGVLDKSRTVADLSFAVMALSFVMFSFYLAYVYQQRKRRMRENELLHLKNQEIARRNEFIRYISATIGHEFKNNLGRIKRRLDLLPDLPPELRERMDVNMSKLFADIEIFKKISDEREARLIDFKQVNLYGMIRRLSRQFADMAEFTIDGGRAAPEIFASPVLLRTVFENIIDNAIKYRKPGQAVAKIHVAFSHDIDIRRRYVTISFRDEGMGMDERQADQCFYKGRRQGEGWGEGLYFAKYVVGLHAGKVRVGKDYTAPSRGTEIIINLPLVEEEMDV